jgi:hypothetical protein
MGEIDKRYLQHEFPIWTWNTRSQITSSLCARICPYACLSDMNRDDFTHCSKKWLNVYSRIALKYDCRVHGINIRAKLLAYAPAVKDMLTAELKGVEEWKRKRERKHRDHAFCSTRSAQTIQIFYFPTRVPFP